MGGAQSKTTRVASEAQQVYTTEQHTDDLRQRFLPMNCISWNVGHLAWQEQRYFLHYRQGQILMPEIDKNFAFGALASTPSLKEMLAAWQAITQAADP